MKTIQEKVREFKLAKAACVTKKARRQDLVKGLRAKKKGTYVKSDKLIPDRTHITMMVEGRNYIKELMSRRDKSCVYCGDWYECRDHVIPVCWEGLPRKYAAGDVVPSCNECNHLLSNRPIFNIASRASYLIGAYYDKRLKFLRFPKWTDSEISDLGFGLRIAIERRTYLQKLYEAKIANLSIVENGGEAIAI